MGQFVMHPLFEAELLASLPVKTIIEDRTDAVVSRAQALAPDDPRTSGRDLHSQIEGNVELDQHGWHGRASSMAFYGHLYEFGASNVPAQPYMRPALEAEVGRIERGPER